MKYINLGNEERDKMEKIDSYYINQVKEEYLQSDVYTIARHALVAIINALGSALPTSSDACIIILLAINFISSPDSISLAR